MNRSYIYTYILVTVCAFIIGATCYTKLNMTLGKEREIRYFKYMILSFLAFSITDVIWFLSNIKFFYVPDRIHFVLTTINLISVTFVAVIWYLYFISRVNDGLLENKLFWIISFAPYSMTILSLFMNCFPNFRWVFSIVDGAMKVDRYYHICISTFSALYLLIPVLYGICLIITNKGKSKSSNWSYILVNAIPIIAIVLDSMANYTPNVALGIVMAIFLTFTSLQESLVYTDALTGLNNRRRSDIFLEDIIKSDVDENRENNTYILCIIDINKFKKINDNFGHIEGDNALILLAKTIKQMAEIHRLFAARWAGDEFLFIGLEKEYGDKKTFVREFNQRIKEACLKNNVPYQITVSIGFSKIKKDDESIEDVVIRADRELYKQKAKN